MQGKGVRRVEAAEDDRAHAATPTRSLNPFRTS